MCDLPSAEDECCAAKQEEQVESAYDKALKRMAMRPPRELMMHVLEMQQQELEDLAWFANIGGSAEALANAYAVSLDLPKTELVCTSIVVVVTLAA